MTHTFDGHYWVVRDGEIIDPMFPYYEDSKALYGLKGKRIYLPADDLTQRVFKRLLNTHIEQFEEEGYQVVNDWEIAPGGCGINAYVEQQLRGGEIVFGSMGWKRKNGNGIHYEYGGEGWNVADFMYKGSDRMIRKLDFECMKLYGKKDKQLLQVPAGYGGRLVKSARA